MITRRHVASLGMLSLATRLTLAAPTDTAISEEDELPPLPRTKLLDLSGSEGEPDFASRDIGQQALGRYDPGKEVKSYAANILKKAPYDCRPIEVAKYFHALGRGKTKFGEEGRPYARGWPHYYNPVIVEFFTVTNLKPSGDETSWCAAFLNYCIARAASKDGRVGPKERLKGTGSASSGSFRCFGEEVPDGRIAKEGDIAVWALDGTVNKCRPGMGHVGFVVGNPTGDADRPHLILGGNQSGNLLDPKRTRRDGIFVKAMPAQYVASSSPIKYKKVFGYRTASFL